MKRTRLVIEVVVEDQHVEALGLTGTVRAALREFGFETRSIEERAALPGEEGVAGLVDAAEAVVATAEGSDYGLTRDDVIEAMKMAAAALKEALAGCRKA